MAKKKQVIEEKEKINDIQEINVIKSSNIKSKKCKVILVNNNKISIDFDCCGISLVTDKVFKIGDIVEIKYESEIGKSDFKYELK
jgi:hypothetical protein